MVGGSGTNLYKSMCCQSPSHVGRLVQPLHNVVTGKHSPENFNRRLKQYIHKSLLIHQVQNVQTRTFSKNEGSRKLRSVRIVHHFQKNRTLPIIFQGTVGRPCPQNLLVPVVAEVLEFCERKSE